MNIQLIEKEKREYIDLLLETDPQVDMIEAYLDAGDMFVLFDKGMAQTVCVIVKKGINRCELKNLVTVEESRGLGYGTIMMNYICKHYQDKYERMYVGVGNSERTLAFYQKCGFENSHIKVGFYTEHYKEPIYKDNILLTDMIYLKKKLDSEVDIKKVLDLAAEAGRILLKNGGEIFRVEETIAHICKSYQVEQVDTFTMSHAIIINAETGGEEAFTKIKHVPLSAAHLGIVAEVNDLSREIAAGQLSIHEAFERLRIIDQMPPKRSYFQVLAAGLGSACFGFLLGGDWLGSVLTFGVGCMLYMWVLLMKKHGLSKIIINITGGVLLTTLSIVAIQVFSAYQVRLEGMIIGSIMPLIPGMAFVNAIRDIADSDFLSGTVRMIDALLVFVYIAIGVGFTLGVYNNIIGGGLLL